MAQHHLVVVFALVVTMSSGAATKLKFALLPGTFDMTNAMINATDVGAAASSAQECVDLVVVADPAALAISFDNSTGACKYSTSIYSYRTRSAGQQPAFYLRVDNVMKDPSPEGCLTAEFGGMWYCYDSIPVINGSSALIKNNQCAVALGSGWAPVKISERREYGYVRDYAGGGYTYSGMSYIGLYRQDGTTFVWYDGSAAEDVHWQGYQPNEGAANNMAYVNFDTTVRNDDGAGMTLLICKTPAEPAAYDPTAKFL